MFPTLVASPQTPDRTEEIIAVATLYLRLSDEEFNTLQKRAAAACLSDSAYIRRLIMDKPPVIIDDRFYAAMEIIREFSDKIDEVAMKTDNSVDMIAVMTEARKWRAFQNAIEKGFLRPKRGDG